MTWFLNMPNVHSMPSLTRKSLFTFSSLLIAVLTEKHPWPQLVNEVRITLDDSFFYMTLLISFVFYNLKNIQWTVTSLPIMRYYWLFVPSCFLHIINVIWYTFYLRIYRKGVQFSLWNDVFSENIRILWFNFQCKNNIESWQHHDSLYPFFLSPAISVKDADTEYFVEQYCTKLSWK